MDEVRHSTRDNRDAGYDDESIEAVVLTITLYERVLNVAAFADERTSVWTMVQHPM